MESFVILRKTILKSIRIPPVKKTPTREENEEYIRLWKQLAKDLNVKP